MQLELNSTSKRGVHLREEFVGGPLKIAPNTPQKESENFSHDGILYQSRIETQMKPAQFRRQTKHQQS